MHFAGALNIPMHTRTHARTFVRTHIHTQRYRKHTCGSARKHTRTRYVRTYVRTYARTPARTRARGHTHAHMRARTYIPMLLLCEKRDTDRWNLHKVSICPLHCNQRASSSAKLYKCGNCVKRQLTRTIKDLAMRDHESKPLQGLSRQWHRRRKL